MSLEEEVVDEDEEEEEIDDEESSDYSSDESFDESKVGIALELPKRENRGKKISQLVGDELEKDQKFWGHETWEEDAVDDDYKCSEGEEQYAYSTDSDFDDPEEDETEEVDENKFKERKKKKFGAYVDPALLRNKRTLQAIARRRTTTNEQTIKKPTPTRKIIPIPDGSDTVRERRETTKKKTEAIKELQEKRKSKKIDENFNEKKKKPTTTRHHELTYEELMEQARKTEEANTKSLQHLQAWEDEKRRYSEVNRYKYKGHYDIWISWNSLLSIVTANDEEVAPPPNIEEKPLELYMFTTGQLPEFYRNMQDDKLRLQQWSPPCSYSDGSNAKYFDPLTRRYYNTIDEFKLLRIAYENNNMNDLLKRLDVIEDVIMENVGTITTHYDINL